MTPAKRQEISPRSAAPPDRAVTPAAERQRRSRRHKAGDHRICLPERCELAGQVEESVTDESSRDVTPTRGAKLWSDMAGDSLPAGQRVLLQEACRIADRLDKLDALLAGTAQDWVSLVEVKGDPERQEVVIDRPLAEARQQATALKQLIAEIRAAGGTKPASTATPVPAGEGVAGVTDLATWAPARSAKSAG